MARHCSEVRDCMLQWRERQTSWSGTQHAPVDTKQELQMNTLPEEPDEPALCVRLPDESDSVYDEKRLPESPVSMFGLAVQGFALNEEPSKVAANPGGALLDDQERDAASDTSFDVAPSANLSKAAATLADVLLDDQQSAATSGIGFDAAPTFLWTNKMSIRTHTLLSQKDNSRIMRLVSCPMYDKINFAVVLANAVFVGVQTQYMVDVAVNAAQKGDGGLPMEKTSHQVLQGLFTAIFTMDLALRWSAHGFTQFLRDSDVAWHVLDLFIVVLGIIDMILSVLDKVQSVAVRDSSLGHVSVFRVLRIVRLVRVSRAVKVIKFFRDLRVMVASIVGSLKSLLWVVVVIVGLLYIFGIVFTVGTATYITQPMGTRHEDIRDVISYFGSLQTSMLSLFMAMSGGADWREFYDVLARMGSLGYIFLIFILFSLFAVVNIVTGIFVENAVHVSRSDSSLVIQEQIDSMRTRMDELQVLYLALDVEGTGHISRDELKSRIKNGCVAAAFAAIDFPIGAHDAGLLFDILDKDGSHEISVREFVDGCYSLLGKATSFDTKMLRLEVEALRKSMHHLEYKLLGKHAEQGHSDVPSFDEVAWASRCRPAKVNVCI